ncbi:FtsX-like permease family protein [Streptomyces sp. NPDC059452]|uniref:FtsX-like permease family protein n=1 Tax=Streptomyces sp. NPDC059452 TaxID=3346835 RepID=UPI0036A87045
MTDTLAPSRPKAGPGGRRRPAGEVIADQRTTRFLAKRSMRRHRKAWAAVFAALVLTSLLLGSFALATLSAFAGHARVERYAATTAVVAGDQSTRYTAKPWGDPPTTVTAALTERVRVPRSLVPRIEAVEGVRSAVADDNVPLTVADGDGRAVPGRSTDSGRAPVSGHGWQVASLAPFTLRDGRAPATDREVVLDGDLAARAGARVGDRVQLQAYGSPVLYEVSGIAAPRGEGDSAGLAHQGTVFFTDAHARRLAGHPDTTDAIGVLAEPGVSVHALYPALRKALDEGTPAKDASADSRYEEDSAALRVLTGNGRGDPEFVESAPSRSALLMLLSTVCATVLMIALLVVASTVTQAIHQRAREMALLRAVGATPRQLRLTVGREVRGVAVPAAVLGAIGAVPVFLLLIHLLRARGAVPIGLELPTAYWLLATPVVTAVLTLVVARVSAAIACGRIAKVRPAQAMGEAATEPEQPGRGRSITGVVLLFAGLSSAGTAVLQYGELAAMAASTAAMALVIACALLGPWIARAALRVLGAPARKLGPGGYLAVAASQANSRRLGAAITPIVLVVAFVGVQLSAGATLDREGSRQAAAAMNATLEVTTDGPGIPQDAVDAVRQVPGVAAATGVMHSTVVLARRETGEPKLDRLPVIGVDPAALPATLDPDVSRGSLGKLGAGTVAIGEDRARSLGVGVGDKVTVRYGDGAAVAVEVAALYRRSLALGDFLFSTAELAPHVAAPLNRRVLVAEEPGGGDVRAAVERALGGSVLDVSVSRGPAAEHLESEDRGVGQVITVVAVSVIGVFTVISVLNTLTLIMVGRRQELALLRLVGSGRGQIRRMLTTEATLIVLIGLIVGGLAAAIPLTAFSFALAGSLPYIPPLQAGLIVLTMVVTTFVGCLVPAGSALRRKHPAGLGGR